MRKYKTISGDTWDLIAFKEYARLGGERLTSALIEANPRYIQQVIFPAGIELDIPEAYIPASETLPPWMK